MPGTADPLYFPTPARFRAWLKRNRRSASELWVGFYKKGSGTPSITWPEAVDEALCVGWIDWHIVSAKREDTRKRRLAKLIECSARGRPIPELRRARG